MFNLKMKVMVFQVIVHRLPECLLTSFSNLVTNENMKHIKTCLTEQIVLLFFSDKNTEKTDRCNHS